ncbi:MAG TPA: archease [Alphaproteobacteria bacterium]|nr:archease [Alphaproteobacteria bacterium]
MTIRYRPASLTGINIDVANVRNTDDMSEAATSAQGYELFPHGADIGIRGWGRSMAEAFAQGARALTSIVTEPFLVNETHAVQIACAAPDGITLFVDWINAIILEMDVRKMLFGRFDIVISADSLEATIWGEPVDRTRHQPAAEPKGATFTLAKVFQDKAGLWIAQCVVDV